MIDVFAESGPPVFGGISALSRGTTTQENIELIMRTIHSANQLSIYGAVPSW